MKDITQLAAELGRRLQVLNAHVTTAESCTGGGIAEAITRRGFRLRQRAPTAPSASSCTPSSGS